MTQTLARCQGQLASDEATQAFGARLMAASTEGGVIYLTGDLGAGKTTLVRGGIRALGYSGPVKSPTYTLMEPYQIDGRQIFHLDLYRLGDPEEVEYLGLRDQLGQEALILIEWPDKGRGFLPEADLAIEIHHQAQGRTLICEAGTERGQLLLQRLMLPEWDCS